MDGRVDRHQTDSCGVVSLDSIQTKRQARSQFLLSSPVMRTGGQPYRMYPNRDTLVMRPQTWVAKSKTAALWRLMWARVWISLGSKIKLYDNPIRAVSIFSIFNIVVLCITLQDISRTWSHSEVTQRGLDGCNVILCNWRHQYALKHKPIWILHWVRMTSQWSWFLTFKNSTSLACDLTNTQQNSLPQYCSSGESQVWL